jgi:hypothetical protein
MKLGILLSVSLLIAMSPLSAQWNTNIQQNNQISYTGTEAAVPYSVTHPSGITYVGWFSPGSGGDYYPWLQKVDAEGYIGWTNTGIQVSSHPSMTWITDYDMAVCPDTGVIISFQDMRNGANDVFIYKLSPSGQFLWGPDGVELSNEPNFEANPVLAVHPDNSVVVAWPRALDPGDGQVIMQRLNAAGQKQWDPDIVLTEAGFDYTWPRVVPAEDGNTILVWYKEWGPYWAPNRNILAQKFSPDGVALWPFNVSLFSGAMPLYVHPLVAADGSGGAYVAWTYEKITNKLSSFVQHVDASGTVTMVSGGVEVSLNSNLHLEPAMACDTTTGSLYIFWRETNNSQSQYGLYGQKIEPDGTLSWGNNAKMLVALSSKNVILINVNGIPGGTVVSYLYDDFGTTTDQKVKAARLDEAGNMVWSGGILDVSTNQSGKGYLSSGDFMNSQFVFSWSDDRLGHTEIFAQNLSVEGVPGPMTWDMEVFPDTLWFLTPESTMNGLLFFIHNPNTYTLDVQYIQQEGFPGPNLESWYVDPHIFAFPVLIEPGDTFSRLVRFPILDRPASGPLAYDTLNIWSLTDSARVIIAVDTMLIWMGTEEHPKTPFRIFPNPCQGRTTIQVSSSCSDNAVITIYDNLMRPARQLFSGPLKTGINTYFWDGKGDNGNDLPDGIYFVRLTRNGQTVFGKILVAH